MNTECTRTKLMFHGLGGRQVVGRFDGGEITSDGGGVLLREAEHRTRILGRLSQCLTDHRDPDRIEHSVEGLIKQRVLGLCLGYEDLNDHDELCRDRLLALLCDRDDLTGWTHGGRDRTPRSLSHVCRCGLNLRGRFPVSQDGVCPSLESDLSIPLLSPFSIADRPTDLFGQKRRRMGDGASSLAGAGALGLEALKVKTCRSIQSIDPTHSVRGISGAWTPEPIQASMSFERTLRRAVWRDYRVGPGEQYCERCGTVAETVPHLAVAKVCGDSFRLGAKGVSCRSRSVNGTRRVDSQIAVPAIHRSAFHDLFFSQ